MCGGAGSLVVLSNGWWELWGQWLCLIHVLRSQGVDKHSMDNPWYKLDLGSHQSLHSYMLRSIHVIVPTCSYFPLLFPTLGLCFPQALQNWNCIAHTINDPLRPNTTHYFQPSFLCLLPSTKLHGQTISSSTSLSSDSSQLNSSTDFWLLVLCLPLWQGFQPTSTLFYTISLGIPFYSYGFSYHHYAGIPTPIFNSDYL